jgi:hypothetical protein
VLTNTEKKAKKEKFKKNVKAQVIKTQLKPLTQAMLMAELKGVLSTLPDKRTRTPQHSMLNVGLAAFSVFFMQLPSFLASNSKLEPLNRNTKNKLVFVYQQMAKKSTDVAIDLLFWQRYGHRRRSREQSASETAAINKQFMKERPVDVFPSTLVA